MNILPVISRKFLIGLSVTTAALFGAVCVAAPPKLPDPEFTVKVEIPKGKSEGTLTITAKIPISPATKGPYHIYSTRTSDKVNGGRATKVVFDKGSPWTMLDKDFTADHKPHELTEEGAEPNEPVEQFEKEVTWTRKIKLKPGFDPGSSPLTGKIQAQMCDAKTCRFIKKTFKAQVTVVE